MQVADIEWEAPYPFWQDVADSSAQFQASGAGLQFPLYFPVVIPENNVEQGIINLGDVDAPIIARLYGDMTIVRLINETTGEVLEITGNIPATQYVEVATGFGEKKVELVTIATGARVSILDRVNLAKADFWSLRAGDNVVRFEADTNVSGYMQLYWRPRYTGV